MQKKIIALAVAGLSTAAFAQTNVTIYGVADVSAQGYNMSSNHALAQSSGKVAQGGAFNMTNNSSLIGFKGTEDLGNGLKALFQAESNVAITGGAAGAQVNTTNATFNSLRDSYVGLSSKYGTALGGYLSTPYRSALNSFDVMPGATGSGRIENFLGNIKLNGANGAGLANGPAAGTSTTDTLTAAASVRATAIAYAMPTLYGFNGVIAYTGTNNNGGSNQTAGATTGTVAPQGALSMNLGWTGYGVNVTGAYQQAKINNTAALGGILQGYTSYLVGASYTGMPGLKVAAVYGRNTLGTNGGDTQGTVTAGAMKGSNNQIWVGASYRFGNNEPRLSYVNSSNTNGLSAVNIGQDGGSQWTANWGYYLSKRTQVYGLVSQVKNNANGVWTPAGGATALAPTGGQNFTTYGAGLRTNF